MCPLAADWTVVECDWLFDPGVVTAGPDDSAAAGLSPRVNEPEFGAGQRGPPATSAHGYAASEALAASEHHLAGFHRQGQKGLVER